MARHKEIPHEYELEETVHPGIHKRIKKLAKDKKEKKKKKDPAKKQSPSRSKIQKVLHEFKHGELHSGSKKGPRVKNRSQAIAIALSEARKAGAKIPKKRG